MTHEASTLADFGWATFFAAQRQPHEHDHLPARVAEVHRDRLRVIAPGLDLSVEPFRNADDDAVATAGDWLLLDPQTRRPSRLLERRSVFKRRAAGTGRQVQLIAANIDTLFVVSSCNQDFNPARLERYLALAREAGVTPVVVLTKADLAEAPHDYARAAAQLMPGLAVETLDARGADGVAQLLAWCGRGQTAALVGSSGVGKSTLASTLTGDTQIATQAAREDDDRGRHTTTGRALHRLPNGSWLLDTPGMRELQLTDVKAGIAEVFADIDALAHRCRFSDCGHHTEPGCAVQAALASGEIDAARVKRWRKLVAEEAHNTVSLSERRARERAFGRMADRIMAEKRSRRGDD